MTEMKTVEMIEQEAYESARELLEKINLKPGSVLV